MSWQETEAKLLELLNKKLEEIEKESSKKRLTAQQKKRIDSMTNKVFDMWKVLRETKLKELAIESANKQPDFLQIINNPNMMSISPDQLRLALKGDVNNEQNDAHGTVTSEPQGEPEVHSDDSSVPEENTDQGG